MNEYFSGKYFGTDGFRGKYGSELLDEHAELIGKFLGDIYSNEKKARILIGRDTRSSSPLLEESLIRGISSHGGEATKLGICTTPAVAHLAKLRKFDCAVMITASHNPADDNGIKILNSRGEKMEDTIILGLERYIESGLRCRTRRSFNKDLGDSHRGDLINLYLDHLLCAAMESEDTAPDNILSGMRIGLDCANGGASYIAPKVFRALGAEVYQIGTAPDGNNINKGVGSTHISALAALVEENHLNCGFAFDGDGDRCITVDSNGKIIDGDGEMLALAKDMAEKSALSNNKIAVTVMTNKSLHIELSKLGIDCLVTAVGDRFVYEKMRELGLSLGGEQSGHIIIGDEPTGDGVLSAIHLAKIIKKKGSLGDYSPLPQVIKNVKVINKNMIFEDSTLWKKIEVLKEKIRDRGRIVLRKSGTEDLLRVMVEHENLEKCKLIVSKIVDIIEETEAAYKNEN